MKDKRIYADRRKELIRAVAKRRRKIKALSIQYKGGECQLCGYSKYQGVLDLHHKNPTIGKRLDLNWINASSYVQTAIESLRRA